MIKVNLDGSFDIDISNIKISNCYPGIDGKNIHALNVIIENLDGTIKIRYITSFGTIVLELLEKENLTITMSCVDFVIQPRVINPIFRAEITKLKGVFVQKMGLRGEYGYFDISNTAAANSKLESIGIISLKNNNESMIAYACNHEKFVNTYSIEPDFNKSGSYCFSVGFNLEQTRDGNFVLPSINFMKSEKMHDGLEIAAKATAKEMNARSSKGPTCIWSSWYYRFNHMTYDVLNEFLNGFKNSKLTPPYKYIQIDGGYCTTPGDWLNPNYQWPKGLKGAFDLIKASGYLPGIWIAPFVVGNCSNLYKDHPDYVLHDLDGKPVIEKKFYEWNKPWPNFDTEYYILDTSHPGAMAYIIDVFKTLKSYGAMMFKTDFMLWGMVDSDKVQRYSKGKTSVEYFREFLSKIRSAIGEESYWLGCIAPFLPFISFADGMRIAGDVVSFYEPSHVKRLASKFIGSNYFNHIYWENDPDVVILRDFDTDLKENEAVSMALFQAFTGGLLGISDPLYKADLNRQKLFNYLVSSKIRKPCYPFFDENTQEIIATYSDGDKHIILVFNPGDIRLVKKIRLNTVLGIEKGYIFEKNTSYYSDNQEKEIYIDINSRESRVYYISAGKKILEEPSNLWWE